MINFRNRKRESKSKATSKFSKLGTPLKIQDKNNNQLCCGDIIKVYNEECIILYDSTNKEYKACLIRSMWYGNNTYDINCYGKAYTIRMDDGQRMEIEKIKEGDVICAYGIKI